MILKHDDALIAMRSCEFVSDPAILITGKYHDFLTGNECAYQSVHSRRLIRYSSIDNVCNSS